MKRSTNYNTRQREAILEYIASLEGAHVTAAQIAEHFKNEAVPIGRTTIYRQLDKLTEAGSLRRYITDGFSGACYQLIGNAVKCDSHLHLKCEVCGELQHLECDVLDELGRHMFSEHDFKVDALKTVLYGKCGACLETNVPSEQGDLLVPSEQGDLLVPSEQGDLLVPGEQGETSVPSEQGETSVPSAQEETTEE